MPYSRKRGAVARLRRSLRRIREDGSVRIKRENFPWQSRRFRLNSSQQMPDTCSPLSVFSVSRVFEKAAPPSARSREKRAYKTADKKRSRERERMKGTQKSGEKQRINLIASEKQKRQSEAPMFAFVFDRDGNEHTVVGRIFKTRNGP